MIIGTPKEIKNHEYRVGLTPESTRELSAHGHRVLVQTGAGEGIGAHDRYYVEAGAEIVQTAEEIFATCDMVVKVKEPQPGERAMLREGQILYTYLHLAPDPDQTRDLMKSGAVCIAYETVTSPHGGLPLLKPMSQVAGRMSIQAGATALEKAHGGRGVLLGGVPGVAAVELGKAMGARVVAGVSSEAKAEVARQAGADAVVVYGYQPFDKGASKALANMFKDAVGPDGANVIYDAVGGDYAEPALRSIAWEGRYLVVGFPAGIPRLPLNLTLLKSCDVAGVFWGAFVAREPVRNRANIARLFQLWEQGKINPRVTESFSLADGGKAIAKLGDRSAVGKLVVTI